MDPAESVTDRPAPRFDEAGDATRRTWLANERTWLAWVRTGLTCTAVALGVGKVVPDLAKAGHRWPYTVLGVGYAVLGALLVLYGFQRRGEVGTTVVLILAVREQDHCVDPRWVDRLRHGALCRVRGRVERCAAARLQVSDVPSHRGKRRPGQPDWHELPERRATAALVGENPQPEFVVGRELPQRAQCGRLSQVELAVPGARDRVAH